MTASLSLDTSFDGRFGTSVAIFGDTVAVGAPDYYFDGTDVPVGAVFIYSNGDWSNFVKISPTEAVADAYFGYNVAIKEKTLAVSAFDVYGNGVVYVYTNWEGKGWEFLTLLLPSPSAVSSSYYGESLTLIPISPLPPPASNESTVYPCDVTFYNSTVIAVGAPGDDTVGELSGAAYLYLVTSAPCSFYGTAQISSLAMKFTSSDSKEFMAYGESIAAG